MIYRARILSPSDGEGATPSLDLPTFGFMPTGGASGATGPSGTQPAGSSAHRAPTVATDGAANGPAWSAALLSSLSPDAVLSILMLQRYEAISDSVRDRMGDLRTRAEQSNQLRSFMSTIRDARGGIGAEQAVVADPATTKAMQELRQTFGVDVKDNGSDNQWTGNELDRWLEQAQSKLDSMTSDDSMSMQLLMRSYQQLDECVTAMSTRSKAVHETAQSIIRNGA